MKRRLTLVLLVFLGLVLTCSSQSDRVASKKVADDLKTGEMEDRVAHIFMEADHIYVQDVLDAANIYSALRV